MSAHSTRTMRILLALWWIAMTIGSLWPRFDAAAVIGVSNNSIAFGVDKWLHTTCFIGLIWFGLSARLFPHQRRVWRIINTIELMVAFAFIDELSQTLSVGRDISLGDVSASCTGIAIGTLIWVTGRWLSDHDNSFVAHTRIVAVLTLISRIFGLARDWSLAWVFGFGWVYDAFVIAFMIPNLFRRLFGEGALAAAFVPQYTRLLRKDQSTAAAFANRVLWRIVKWVTALTLVGIALLIVLDLFVAQTDRGLLIVRLTMLTLWYAPLVCAAAILGAVLQVHGRFGPPAAAPVILNIFIIGACFIAGVALPQGVSMPWRIAVVCVAVVIAGVIQVAWQWSLRPQDESPAPPPPDTDLINDGMGRLLRQWGPTVVGLAVFQLNVLADSLIAWFFSAPPGSPIDAKMHLLGMTIAYPMRSGAVSVLGASARLYEFPIGVFGIAVATAIFPQLASAAEHREQFTDLLHRGLRLTVLIGLPASLGLILVRHPLASAIYHKGGKVTAADADRIAWILSGYAPAIWAYSMNHLLTRTFYAKQNTITPMRVAVAMVALNVVLNLTLIWWLGAAGLAWATATCAMLQSVILLRLVRRYVDTPISRDVVASWIKSGLVTAAMCAVVFGVLFHFNVDEMTRWATVGLLIAATVAGAAAVAGVAILLRMPEVWWVLRRKAMPGAAITNDQSPMTNDQ